MTSGELADATVVFDLDGTLVDTAPDLVRALNETLDLEGLPHARLDAVRAMVGKGARKLIETSAGLAGAHFSAPRLDELTEAFVGFYRADIARHSKPFPGAVEALDAMAALGAKFSICTNKRTELSVKLIDALNLSRYFSAIVGADAVENRKPHPDHLRAAVDRAGGVARRSLMVGDTSIDIAAARGANVPVILARFGYLDGEAERLGADAIIDRFSELPAVCRRLLAAAG